MLVVCGLGVVRGVGDGEVDAKGRPDMDCASVVVEVGGRLAVVGEDRVGGEYIVAALVGTVSVLRCGRCDSLR